MHYANGRPAQNGDKVIVVPKWGGMPQIGVLFDACEGNDSCNGNLAPIVVSDRCPNLSECLRLDDAIAMLRDLASVPRVGGDQSAT